MVVSIRSQAPVGTSVQSLVKGFVLTQRTDYKSLRTIEYYESNLRRFLWYANQQEWPDDVRLITEWHIREFIIYLTPVNFTTLPLYPPRYKSIPTQPPSYRPRLNPTKTPLPTEKWKIWKEGLAPLLNTPNY